MEEAYALSAEEIEAIPCHEYLKLKDLAAYLHGHLGESLDLQDPKQVQEQEELRTSVILKLDEAMASLSKDIANMRALKKDIEISQGYASADRARIKSQKISLYVARKEGRA